MTEAPAATQVALYRLYDRDDCLLYVGITSDPKQRWHEHSHRKPWWRRVTRKDVEWHDSRDLAGRAEAIAIRNERPTYNRIPSSERSVVYFAATVLPGVRTIVKIGSTPSLANCLTRIQNLDNIARRQRPIVVHLEVGGYERKGERLEQFADFNVTREWFTDDVLHDSSVVPLGDPHEYVVAHPEIYLCVYGWAGHRARQDLHPLKLPTAEERDALAQFHVHDGKRG